MKASETVTNYFTTAEEQAEITWPIAFKAGQEQGYIDGTYDGIQRQLAEVTKLKTQIAEARQVVIKELAEWVNNHSPCGTTKSGLYTPIRPRHIKELMQGRIPEE